MGTETLICIVNRLGKLSMLERQHINLTINMRDRLAKSEIIYKICSNPILMEVGEGGGGGERYRKKREGSYGISPIPTTTGQGKRG